MKMLLLLLTSTIISAQREEIVPYGDFLNAQMIAGKELMVSFIDQLNFLCVCEDYFWTLLSMNCF